MDLLLSHRGRDTPIGVRGARLTQVLHSPMAMGPLSSAMVCRLQRERGGRNVPTGMLYGTVVEHMDITVEEVQNILVRLVGSP